MVAGRQGQGGVGVVRGQGGGEVEGEGGGRGGPVVLQAVTAIDRHATGQVCRVALHQASLLHCIPLHCTALHCTALHCTVRTSCPKADRHACTSFGPFRPFPAAESGWPAPDALRQTHPGKGIPAGRHSEK
jgi:hypothetical protein